MLLDRGTIHINRWTTGSLLVLTVRLMVTRVTSINHVFKFIFSTSGTTQVDHSEPKFMSGENYGPTHRGNHRGPATAEWSTPRSATHLAPGGTGTKPTAEFGTALRYGGGVSYWPGRPGKCHPDWTTDPGPECWQGGQPTLPEWLAGEQPALLAAFRPILVIF